MPRDRQRVQLESGLKLSLPKLMRDGLIVPGRPCTGTLRWTYTGTRDEIARVSYSAHFTSDGEGWIRLHGGQLNQTIALVSSPRHFGGRQWYFRCPFLSRDASILWLPPGAKQFACRQRWGRQVAYGSQFESWFDRACTGSRRLRQRLDKHGLFDAVGDCLPPKPKWMRWRTYDRLIERISYYDDLADAHTCDLVARLLKFR